MLWFCNDASYYQNDSIVMYVKKELRTKINIIKFNSDTILQCQTQLLDKVTSYIFVEYTDHDRPI